MNVSADIFRDIGASLPYGINPADRDDLIADIALLIAEGRIDPSQSLKAEIARHLPRLKRFYRLGDNDISLSQPIGDQSGSLVVEDVIAKASPYAARKVCVWCRRRVRLARTYCSPTCALNAAARRRRRVDPDELRHLHVGRWLSLEQSSKALGVSVHAINSAVSRHRLSRKLPVTCRVPGCATDAHRFLNCKGQIVGTLCLAHKREAQRMYKTKSLRKRRPLLSSAERSMLASHASKIRWSKYSVNRENA